MNRNDPFTGLPSRDEHEILPLAARVQRHNSDGTGRCAPVLTGSCGCGNVRFEVSEPLLDALFCHCTRCQKRTGTAYQASAWVVPGSATVTAGAEHLRDWVVGAHARTFCGLCGSAVFARTLEGGEIRAVRMAAIDDDPGLRPAAHQFVAYAAPWQPIPDDGLPRYLEQAPR